MKDCFVFVVIVFSTVTTTDIVPKRHWAKVLQGLIDVNRQRVDTMLKLYQLEEKNFGKRSYLRTAGKKIDDYPKDNEEDNRKSLLIYINGKNNLRNPLETSQSEELGASIEMPLIVEMVNIPENKVTLNEPVEKKLFVDTIDTRDLTAGLNLTKTQEKMLRKRWHSACDKQAAKVCIRACKDAFKTVCQIFTCKGKMKSKMKKECKRTCKSQFGSSGRETASDSDC